MTIGDSFPVEGEIERLWERMFLIDNKREQPDLTKIIDLYPPMRERADAVVAR
jgi:hypothetical protein